MTRNLLKILSKHSVVKPNATALKISNRIISYQMLDDGVWRAVAWLSRQGVKPKDVVAVRLQDPVSLMLAMLGLIRLGATPMPLSPSATAFQIEDFVREASVASMLVEDAKDISTSCPLLICNERVMIQEEPVMGLACESPDAPCLLITGSGSTGKPRLIPVTHYQMRVRGMILAQLYALKAGDRLMVGSPLNFSITIHISLAALSAGITGVIWNQRGTFGEAVSNLKPDVLHLSVLHAEQLLQYHEQDSSFNLSSVRVVSIGASSVSESLRQRLRVELGAQLHIHYGTNETFTLAFAYPSDLDSAPGVVGRPPKGVTVEVVDHVKRQLSPGKIGQVRVRSPAIISGYLGDTDIDRFNEGWFYPGDLAEWTTDGQLVHCGRADHMMITKGINIYPAEIERVLGKHPAVREALAFPFEHRVAQDIPVCAVVLNRDSSASPEELQRFSLERLGAKAPRAVAILPCIPRNEQGKPVREQLIQQVRKSLEKQQRVSDAVQKPKIQSRQRRRRVVFTFSPPSSPRADLVKPWRSLLTDSIEERVSNMLKPRPQPDGDPVRAWLDEALLLAYAFLHEARVPVFDPILALQVQRIPATSDRQSDNWRAKLELPVLDHLPTSKPEPVFAAALKAAINVATWTQQLAEGSSQDANARELFFSKIQNDILSRVYPMAPAVGKSTLNVMAACHSLGVPWSDLGDGIYQLGWGSRSRRIERSTTDGDSAMGMKVARDKARTARWLRAAGLPAAEHQLVRTVVQAQAASLGLGWPVVIKPADAERGEGVSVDVQKNGLDSAFAFALEHSPRKQVLVERQVNGVCHRLFIAKDRLLYAVRRLPIGVYGNGFDSVEKLVQSACNSELKQAPWRRSPIQLIDDIAITELNRQGVQPASVPAAGRFVALRRIESAAWGGVDEDVTGLIHPENLRVALEATRLCGLEVAGIDFISPDISQPWHTNGAVINEVNYAPLLGEAAISRKHVPEFIERLLGGDGRIVVEVFVGDEAAVKAARDKASQLSQQGIAVVVTSHDRTFWGNGQELVLSVSGLYARTRSLILSQAVEALILVVQDDELSYDGLPLEGVDSVVIINQMLSSRQMQDQSVRKNDLLQRLAGWVWMRNEFVRS